MTLEKSFCLNNTYGLHIRAATKLVKIALNYTANINITHENQTINAKSISKVIELTAKKGDTITIIIDGKDAKAAMQALSDLITAKFHESH